MNQQSNPAQQPMAPSAYEFSDQENKTVARTAKWAKAVAIVFFLQVALQVVNLNILGIVLDLAIGISFWKGAVLLDEVVNTKDDDVKHMLGSLEQLRNAFTIRLIFTTIAAVIGIILTVGFFIRYEFMYDPSEVVEVPAVVVEDAEEEDAEEEDAEEEDAEEGEEEDADEGEEDADEGEEDAEEGEEEMEEGEEEMEAGAAEAGAAEAGAAEAGAAEADAADPAEPAAG